MPEESKTSSNKPNSKGSNAVRIIGWIIIFILALAIVAWIYQFIKQNFTSNTTTKPSPSSSSSAVGPLNIKKSPSPNQTSSTTGNWTLSMSDTTVSSSPATRLDGQDSGQVSFQMPSGGSFTATGDWSGESSGTSGPSTISGTVNGKMTITGEIKNSKLHFTVSYAYSQCATTITTPIGSNTDEICPTTPSSASHSLDIEITDGATAAYTITSAGVNGTENWTLKKAQ